MKKLSKASGAVKARRIRSALKVGCCVAMLWVAGTAEGQIVQVAGERNDAAIGSGVQLIGNAGTRVSTRRMMLDLPQDAQRAIRAPVMQGSQRCGFR